MLLAISGLASLLPLVLVLACPLMMIFMMRGMHGGGGGGRGHAAGCHGGGEGQPKSLDDLKHERDQLNEEIARRAEESVDARRAKVFG